MLRGGAASWWDGSTALDGGAKYETPKQRGLTRSRSEALERTAKTELFGHLRIRPHHNPEAEAPSTTG